MKVRVRLREQTAVVVVAIAFAFVLLAVNTVWPQGFTVVIAIGGTLGALTVLYEVRLTQQIAQAEFIRDLQTSFSSDPNIVLLWRKLLLKEEITAADRPLMSSYLTFFETVHLLHARGALDLSLTDELFRNRFFTAIGHPVILQETLVKSVGAFTNIHQLIADWHRHLLAKGKPAHPGYYAYIEAVTTAKGFEVAPLEEAHLDDLLRLQHEVVASLGPKAWLRKNTPEMLSSCLAASGAAASDAASGPRGPQHRALGAFKDGALVAAAILYDGGTGEESIKRYLTDDHTEMRGTANLKLVLTDPAFRGFGLGKTLIELLEHQAVGQGKRELLCTIHPENSPSTRLFRRLGYARQKKVKTKYGERAVFARRLPSVDAHWIR